MDTTVSSESPLIVVEAGAADWKRLERLPAERYISREFLAHELRMLFPKTWVIIGRTGTIPNPGDFFTFDLAGEPLMVVNQGEGEFRAFYNVCRHRGRRLCDEACGNATTFRCIYHNWTYERSGALRTVPWADSFPPGFDKAQNGLTPVRLGQWGGMLFVNLDGNAEPLTDYLGPLIRCMEGWFIPNKLKVEGSVELGANWKLILDNFYEFYHLAGLHPQRGGKLHPDESAYALFRRHAMQVIPMAPKKGWSETKRSHNWADWLVQDRNRHVGFGYHLALFPNVSVHINPHVGTVSFLQGMPHPTDPEKSRMNWWKFMLDESPPEPWIEAQMQQDIDNMIPHATGLRSRSFVAQQLNSHECRVAHFHATIDDYISGKRS